MTTKIKDLLDNTKKIFMTDSAVNTLMDFERVIDALDVYTFENWKKGELVEGPLYEKYFVRCVFMWPYKLMPNPKGAARLAEFDCDISYKKDFFETPMKVEKPTDFRPGTKVPKLRRLPVWLVSIAMPKKLMSEIQQGALELESGTVDLEDIDSAYETNKNTSIDTKGSQANVQ